MFFVILKNVWIHFMCSFFCVLNSQIENFVKWAETISIIFILFCLFIFYLISVWLFALNRKVVPFWFLHFSFWLWTNFTRPMCKYLHIRISTTQHERWSWKFFNKFIVFIVMDQTNFQHNFYVKIKWKKIKIIISILKSTPHKLFSGQCGRQRWHYPRSNISQ